MVFVALLCFSVVVSRQRRQINRLIEETAILSAELRDLRKRSADVPAGAESSSDVVPDARTHGSEPAR
jgi:hypothetical protein